MRRLIVEADGGSRGNPGPAAGGAVVRDADTGELLAECAEYIGTATNNVAEYRGLIVGLRAAHQIDSEAQVEVRMDSRLVVEQVSGRWKIKHENLRPLALEARSVFPGLRGVRLTWVPREANKDADRMVNQALDTELGVTRSRRAPRAAVDDEPAPPAAADQPPGVGREAAREAARQARVQTVTAPTTLVLLCAPDGTDPERAQAQLELAVSRLRRHGTVQAVADLTAATGQAATAAAFCADRLGLAASAPDPGTLLARYDGRTALVVAGPDQIRALVGAVLDLSDQAARRLELDPAGLSAVQYRPGGDRSLRLLNDTAHLWLR